jgi:hypothetical protein
MRVVLGAELDIATGAQVNRLDGKFDSLAAAIMNPNPNVIVGLRSRNHASLDGSGNGTVEHKHHNAAASQVVRRICAAAFSGAGVIATTGTVVVTVDSAFICTLVATGDPAKGGGSVDFGNSPIILRANQSLLFTFAGANASYDGQFTLFYDQVLETSPAVN